MKTFDEQKTVLLSEYCAAIWKEFGCEMQRTQGSLNQPQIQILDWCVEFYQQNWTIFHVFDLDPWFCLMSVCSLMSPDPGSAAYLGGNNHVGEHMIHGSSLHFH